MPSNSPGFDLLLNVRFDLILLTESGIKLQKFTNFAMIFDALKTRNTTKIREFIPAFGRI